MGVQGLWQLLNPTGRPVSLQSLEGKILAIDVSIWLHQAVKGMRGRDGNPLPNAHLQVLFNRLCKLLYYRIKPVFVFDGGVPVLKKQTMAIRREKKEFAEFESDKATKNLVQNLMKSHAIKEVLKTETSQKTSSVGPKPSSSKDGKPDLFELPPLPVEFKSIAEESRRTEFTANERMLLEDIDLGQIDIDSDVFKSLPAEMRHEVLTLLKEKKKRNTWSQILELPEESNDFSKFQMQKLMKQNKLSSHLATVTKEMNDNRSGDITKFLGDDFYSDVIETRKIMSDDSTHSVLIKGLGSKEQKEEMDRIKLELEQNKPDDKHDENKGEIRNISKDEASEIKEIDFASIKVDESNISESAERTQIQISENLLMNSGHVKNSCNGTLSKDVGSERKDILKEIQQRMNDLKDKSTSEIISCEIVSDDKIEPILDKDFYGSNNGEDNTKKEIISDIDNESICKEKHNLDFGKTETSSVDISNRFSEDENNKRQKINESIEKPDVTPQEPVKDLTTTRQSILDELRQKVNVLNADVQLTCDMEELENDRKEEQMQINTERSESEIKQTISENRKALLKKQLSLEEEQVAKKPRLNDSNYNEEKSPAEESSSESEDEGFIEVTLDIDKVQPDELFPADMFKSVSPEITTQDEQFRSPIQVDENIVDMSLDEESSEGKITPIDLETQEEMSYDDKYETAESQRDLVEQFNNFTENEMRDYQENLEVESREIQQEKGRQERLAANITDQMYTEAQEFLELFGVPYIISPMEAEAQCAQLDISNLTQGTITDDSDIWLFGGKRVYRNFFNQDKHVEFFTDVTIQSQLGLNRDILIKLAFLCGSDYTPGIQSVGPITAMEILTQFPGDGIDGLKAFKKWWDEAQTQITAPLEPKIKTKLRKLDVHEGFPNDVVVNAYMNPEVDDSQEKFSWGSPELDLIRIFTEQKLGWNKEKCDETLLPMMKQFNLKQTQTRINNFFQPENFLQPKNIKSKRLQRAIGIMQGKGDDKPNVSDNLIGQSSGLPSIPNVSQTTKRQITVGKGRGRGKGKGKGKGKSSVGQRSQVLISNEINLSESSSESSGDDLIANLDYESLMGDNEPEVKPNPIFTLKNNTKNKGDVSKRSNVKSSKQKRSKTAPSNDVKTGATKSVPSDDVKTNVTKPATSNTIQTTITTMTSSSSSGTIPSANPDPESSKGRRTKPNIRIGKAGHATDEFASDLPKEKQPTTGFLEEEEKTFDKRRKVKSKSQTSQKSETKKKSDKGTKSVKNNKTITESKPSISTASSVSHKTRNTDIEMTNNSETASVVDTLLHRRTRSSKTGLINRVMVVSDSDSD